MSPTSAQDCCPPADWTCDTCALTMPATFQNSHSRGKRHLARIRTGKSSGFVSGVDCTAQDLVATNIWMAPPTWWTCETCHVTLRDECRDAHTEGRLHQAGLKKERDIGKGARRAVTKAKMGEGVPGTESIIKVPHSQAAHISGKSHVARDGAGDVGCDVESVVPGEVSAKVVDSWRCTTCDIIMNTGSMESHLSGTAHRAKIRAGKLDSRQSGNIVRRQEPGDVGNTAKASKAHSPAKLPLGDQRNLQCEKFGGTVEEQRLRDAARDKEPTTRGHSHHDPSRRQRPSPPERGSQEMNITGVPPWLMEGAQEETANKKKIARDLDTSRARDLKSHRQLSSFGWNTDALPSADQKLQRGTVGWRGLVSSNRKGKKGRGNRAQPAEPQTWRIEEWARANGRLPTVSMAGK